MSISKEELNKLDYITYYRKNPKESYSIYKKTQVIIKIIQALKFNLQNKNILDIGFGTGSTLLSLSQINCRLYGIEFIREANLNLRLKTKNNVRFNLILSSISTIPFKKNSFHIIICSHVLEHVKEDYSALMEIWRVLCKKGNVIFLTPNENYGNRHKLHYRTYSYVKLENLIKNKFSIIFRLKYRSFIDNYMYKIPEKFYFLNRILNISSFFDLFFARKFRNLEDLYLLIKK